MVNKDWEKGYLRATINIKMVANKFLKGLVKKPLEVKNGGNVITFRDLKKGLDWEVKKHLERKKFNWKKTKQKEHGKEKL